MPRILLVAMLVGIVVGACVNDASADQTLNRAATVAPGGKIRIGGWTYFDNLESCKPGDPLPIASGTAPRLGQVSNMPEKMTDRRFCKTVELTGTAVYYQAGSVPGTDTFQYFVRYPFPPGVYTINMTMTIK